MWCLRRYRQKENLKKTTTTTTTTTKTQQTFKGKLLEKSGDLYLNAGRPVPYDILNWCYSNLQQQRRFCWYKRWHVVGYKGKPMSRTFEDWQSLLRIIQPLVRVQYLTFWTYAINSNLQQHFPAFSFFFVFCFYFFFCCCFFHFHDKISRKQKNNSNNNIRNLLFSFGYLRPISFISGR